MPYPTTYSPEDDALIRQMRAEGATWKQIADKFDRTPMAVHNHARLKLRDLFGLPPLEPKPRRTPAIVVRPDTPKRTPEKASRVPRGWHPDRVGYGPLPLEPFSAISWGAIQNG